MKKFAKVNVLKQTTPSGSGKGCLFDVKNWTSLKFVRKTSSDIKRRINSVFGLIDIV